MKRLISLCCVLVVLVSLVAPVFASEQETLLSREITNLENGIATIDELYEISVDRALTKEYVRRKTITNYGETIGIIAI